MAHAQEFARTQIQSLEIRSVNIMLIISQLGNITNLIGASGMITVYKDEYVGFTFGGNAVYQQAYPACHGAIGDRKSEAIKSEWR
jgi:hypothetical protein